LTQENRNKNSESFQQSLIISHAYLISGDALNGAIATAAQINSIICLVALYFNSPLFVHSTNKVTFQLQVLWRFSTAWYGMARFKWYLLCRGSKRTIRYL